MALLDIRGHFEFIYFDDLHAACDFFGNVLGLPLVCDQGWSKIYRTSPTSYLGAVDRSQGACKATTRDGVLTSLVINNFDEMHQRLVDAGFQFDFGPHYSESLKIKTMMFIGPEGYKFEVEEFLEPEMREVFYPNLK